MQAPDMSEGMADLMLYKFKKYLGSVSREIQNRRLKMGAYETDDMYNMPVANTNCLESIEDGKLIHKPYRTITMPKCPYCNYKHSNCSPSNYNWSKLVGMATGIGSSDVKLECENCGQYYRVRCNIRFFGSGVEDGNK